MKTHNPFNITKAVDFSDQEINDYWVNYPSGKGFIDLIKPESPMPMLILGGKGSGKTHLMRYFSYTIQKIRHDHDVVEGLRKDGYIGIYLRCAGLNAARFSGKGQGEEVWSAVFSYYMDLWLAQLVLTTVKDALSNRPELAKAETSICQQIVDLFDHSDLSHLKRMQDIVVFLHKLQREVDTAVNNCAINSKLDVRILTTPGKLVFGIPQIMSQKLTSFTNIQFLYLLDEFENLSENQQKHINTLIRDKEIPCSFKIGARLYGIKTYRTYSANEENKEGSEFEYLFLDDQLRTKKHYRKFAKSLIIRRLSEAGCISVEDKNMDVIAKSLESFFEMFTKGIFSKIETNFVVNKYKQTERPYFKSLRKKLEEGFRNKVTIGISSEKDIDIIIKNLTVHDYPLLEKTNIFLLYKDWYAGKQLPQSATTVSKECRYSEVFKHFRGDLFAQLLRDCNQKQRYLGIDTYIDMSSGLPRNFLIILKHIFKWSVFNGENPFQKEKISISSQQKGIKEASEWFFRDARMVGSEGENIQNSISRLATLFREIRFSDKPTECSLSTFSTDISKVSLEAKRTIIMAEKWSLLIKISRGQRDRNTKRVDVKYQLNPMLSPQWDLPVYRRGAIALTTEEANALFDQKHSKKFEKLKRIRIERMTAPLFGKKRKKSIPGQTTFLGYTGD